MKISFKYAIAAVIAGGVFVVALLVGAPIALGVLHFATAKADPTEAEVCAHLDSIGLKVEGCPAWLSAAKGDLGDVYPNRLRCYAAAADAATAKTCDDPAELYSDKWAR